MKLRTTMFAFTLVSLMILPHAAVAAPAPLLPEDVAPAPIDATEGFFIPFVTRGEILNSGTTNNLLSGGGSAQAWGQYGAFRLDLRVDVHYVPEGTGYWVTQTICSKSVLRENQIGTVALNAECTGSISGTPRLGTGIFYCVEAYLYMDTSVLYGWAMSDADGSCGSSRIYNG